MTYSNHRNKRKRTNYVANRQPRKPVSKIHRSPYTYWSSSCTEQEIYDVAVEVFGDAYFRYTPVPR